MRLIDADALEIVLSGKRYGQKFVYADITDAPAVDAIPVEWLRKVMMNDVNDSNSSNAAFQILELWQKEQEART